MCLNAQKVENLTELAEHCVTLE